MNVTDTRPYVSRFTGQEIDDAVRIAMRIGGITADPLGLISGEISKFDVGGVYATKAVISITDIPVINANVVKNEVQEGDS